MGPLYEGSCSFPRWQCLAACSVESGVSVYVKCKSTFTAFSLVLLLVWHLSIVIDGRTSSDRSLGPMLVRVHCVLCLGFI